MTENVDYLAPFERDPIGLDAAVGSGPAAPIRSVC